MKRYSISHKVVAPRRAPPHWELTVKDEVEGIALERFCDRVYLRAHEQAMGFILDMKENDWSKQRWN